MKFGIKYIREGIKYNSLIKFNLGGAAIFTQLNKKNQKQNIGMKFNIPLINNKAREPATLYAEFAIKNIIDLHSPWPNSIQIDERTLEKN